MVPVVAALLLRKSRSGYSFVFVCLCRCVFFSHVCIVWLVNVYGFVCARMRRGGKIIKIEIVGECITFS